MRKIIYATTISAALALSIWTIAAINFQPATFSPGDTLSASELNQLLNDNFGEAQTVINELETRINELEGEVEGTGTGEIVFSHATSHLHAIADDDPDDLFYRFDGTIITNAGHAVLPLTGPAAINGEPYALAEFEYCWTQVGDRVVSRVEVYEGGGAAVVVARDPDTPRSEDGCFSFDVNAEGTAFGVFFVTSGADSQVIIDSARSTWVPASELE